MDDSGRGSDGTSLQISSTSPEQMVGQGRAMHVRKTSSKNSSKGSRSSSVSSSQTARHQHPNVSTPKSFAPPPRNKSRSSTPYQRQSSHGSSEHSHASSLAVVTHRGEGSIVPTDVDMGVQPSSSSIAVQNNQQNLYDQRSIQVDVQNTQQTYQDHRTINVAVGADPQRVLEHVRSVESQAHSVVLQTQLQAQHAVHETRSTAQQLVHDVQHQAAEVVHNTRREAEHAIVQAKSQSASVEERASQLIREMTQRHHDELTQAQDAANQVQLQAHARIQSQDAHMTQLMAVVESQKDALDRQRVHNDQLTAQVAALQNEVVMLRHSSVPVANAQDQNGAVNVEELMVVVDSLRREIRQSRNPSMPIQLPVPQRMSIATPPYDNMSACAGYQTPWPDPPIPTKGQRSNPSTVTPPPLPPSGGSPSGSSSSDAGAGFPGRGGPPSGSSGGGGWMPGGGGPPSGGYSPGGSLQGGTPRRSVGIGSSNVGLTERDVLKTKDLGLIKIDHLPTSAAQYRGWRNSFITKCCSIDLTGNDVILQWINKSFEFSADGSELMASGLLPRLDAHIASLLADAKHLKSEIGMTFQSYIERCQMAGRSPKGRYMLYLLAQQFRLDMQRGSNLTEQALLELDVANFGYDGLKGFVEKTEYILNSIPAEHQPTERTKFTWLFQRLKRCKAIQRHIDRIKDSSETSHRRSFDWLFNKLKTTLYELREDANEESIRRVLSPEKPKAKSKGDAKGKATPATEKDADESTTQTALPGTKPKPKAKPKAAPKGEGKGGKDGGSTGKPKADPNSKGKGSQPPGKAKSKGSSGEHSTVKCLFYPNCNRGSSCPFLHEEARGKAKAESKASPAKAAAKATVATLLVDSFRGAEASSTSGTNMTLLGKTLNMFMYPFKAFFASIAAISSAVVPRSSQSAKPVQVGCLHTYAAPTFVRATESACVAASPQSGTFDVEWICDSGASRSLASIQSLVNQGIPENLVNSCLSSASSIKFETGNGVTNSTECFNFHGCNFGMYEHRILESCPVARSLGEIVSSGRPFIWLPGELPYFVENGKDLQVTCRGKKLSADRIEENVPIFKESIQVLENHSFAMQGVASSMPQAMVGEEHPEAPASDADSEDAGEEPLDRMARLVREAQSPEHLICHFPKNAACPICNRSRMYKKRVRKTRLDPLHDRGALEPVTQFGERIASDFIIVQKTASGKDNTVQVVRDEYSGWIRAYPISKRDTPTVVKNLLSFLGPSYNQPHIMIKSDQASETRLAAQQLGFVFEGTLEKRFPHNSVLERDIRTLEEITRAIHLQAGFDTIVGLWPHSVAFAATMLNAKHAIAGREETRHKLAVGTEFEGRLLLLGQLVHYRVDPLQREKFQASSKPGLFVGWRYGDGPKSHLGVYLVLDYERVKGREPGFQNSISVPAEELYVEEGPPKLPVKVAADQALASFSEVQLDEIMPLDVPFSSVSPETRVKRNEYITLDRIIKYGPTSGCKACAFSSEHSVHNPACRARFNALVRADRVATGTRTPGTPAAPPTPADAPVGEELEPPTVEETEELLDMIEEVEAEQTERVASEDLPFSAGIPPGSSEAAMVGKVKFILDDNFVQRNRSRNMTRRTSSLKGRGKLFEYACSEESILGKRSADIGVDCIRLSRGVLDLTNHDHVQQAIMQLDSVPGADAWISITCTYYSPIQRLNVSQYGERFVKKLNKQRKETRRMLRYALQFAEQCIANHGRVAFELPQEAEIWNLPEWLEFEQRHDIKRAYCNGCQFGLRGKEGKLLRKPWCIATNDLRLFQFVNQYQCDGSHEHGESMGGNAEHTAYYTPAFADMVMESWYPQHWYKHIPRLAAVTKSLTRKEWMNDPNALEALKQEAIGLRSNSTWDDSTVEPLSALRARARAKGTHIKVAELLTLVGIKHFELEPSHWKWKGRIVYRGDQVRDQDNNVLLFDQTATTPTSLVALNVALWFACLSGNVASCSDAIQAFLQSELDDDDLTYVIIPVELWLDEWHDRFPAGTKLVVRLKKSLYGHPRAGRWWQDHLDRRLRNLGAQELPMYPSNYIVPWKIGNEVVTLLLNVYVDDLTLCGDQRCHAEFWQQLRQTVKLEPEQYISHQEGTLILGRRHSIRIEEHQTICEFDMRLYADSIVDTYCELTGFDKSRFRTVPTPHIPEASASDEDLSQTGELSKDASRILMRLLWLSRLTRPDLSFIVARLASRVTTWTRFEDRQLHRCVAYLNTSKEVILKGTVAHEGDIKLHVYTDADFAGCIHSVKSTSGLWVEISSGSDCAFPVYWQSKRQSSVARSTTEAELIAMANGLYGEVYNLQSFVQQLIGDVVEVKFFQDNSAVLQVLKAGYSAKLRHCGRVHKVNVASISESLEEDSISADHCTTLQQKANGFTKIVPPVEWPLTLCQLSLDYKLPCTSVDRR